ncbi:uncharacterized protein LOC133803580 [Humulus lupulus]|uniref:uncharacterized protein LOC133803580 n=1 Tax=Humulus lupulus TaxID=3486 RepID=UPI002B406FD8|nr:uncharacterized protein LOC133803580 [Humulus lupulus]
MEAEMQCPNALQSMEMKLRTTCNATNAKFDNVVKVSIFDVNSMYMGMPFEFNENLSFEGPILDLTKRLIDQVGLEKNTLLLKCRSIEDNFALLNKQLEASDKSKSEYLKRYGEPIDEKKRLADEYMARIANLQSNCSSLGERYSSLLKALDTAKQDSVDWQRKYEQI